MAAKIAIIAMTTNNSIRVNALPVQCGIGAKDFSPPAGLFSAFIALCFPLACAFKTISFPRSSPLLDSDSEIFLRPHDRVGIRAGCSRHISVTAGGISRLLQSPAWPAHDNV